MFSLEKEIKSWKKSLRKNPSLEDGYIEELESHLRDKIEDYVNKGMSEEEAFEKAKNEIGEIENIGAEFFKTDTKNISGKPTWQESKFIPVLMLNYFKIGFRNLKKQKGFSLINILGLAVGLACVILISLLLRYELSFDQFVTKKDRIYRVLTEVKRDNGVVKMAAVMLPFAPAVNEDIPEVENAVRISESGVLSSYKGKNFYEKILYADKDFFKVFSFPFINGNSENALEEPNSIVITKEIAEKYFGNSNPIGQFLNFNKSNLFKITGVIKNLPSNSHLRGNIFVSINSLNDNNTPRLKEWGSFSNDYTYVLLKPNTDPRVVESKIDAMLKNRLEKSYYERYKMSLQPLLNIHLNNDIMYDNAKTTPKVFLYVFGIIAVFILMIAVINFINLTTARSAHRNKEVGIRKVAGASRLQLMKQFLSESFLITFISFLIAIFLVELILPTVSTLLKIDLNFSLLFNSSSIITSILILLFTAIAAGAYPAFVLSGIKPALVLKNAIIKKKNGYSLRATLVVSQFAIAVLLIITTITVYMQLNYMLTKNLGFPIDRIVVLKMQDKKLIDHGETFKNTLLKNNNIIAASFSSGTPGSNTTQTSNFNPKGGSKNDERQLQYLSVDYDFLDTYGLKIKQGRFFSKNLGRDSIDAYILNETGAKKFGWSNPIGKVITIGGNDEDADWKNVVGVLQDFNYSSLKENIPPMILQLKNGGNRYLSLQLSTNDISGTVDYIKKTYSQFEQTYPLNFFFLQDEFEKYYKAESTIGELLGVLTGMAILISCVGILGLAAYSTEQKSKEIGIRKVLGASSINIIKMLCIEFVKWVIIANIIIWPVAYLVTKKFLDEFAYRINFNFLILAATFLLTLIITILTVGFHALRAATNNPVNSLKYE
ncbi:MAG TPA: ABC transporter permease [Ignavibacteriaceae bacterium]|nr:ABC transporter permease [Ignavibacteriaceae bacterium]